MKYYIKRMKKGYYVFTVDSMGNLYDTGRHFSHWSSAIKFTHNNKLERSHNS
jgi:hypothetical protein